MRFGKKNKGNKTQSFKSGNPHRQELDPITRQPWEQPSADEGLPGTCGYFNGIKDGPHPQRFVYVRPDGQEEASGPATDPDGALLPSQRPIRRGFFGH